MWGFHSLKFASISPKCYLNKYLSNMPLHDELYNMHICKHWSIEISGFSRKHEVHFLTTHTWWILGILLLQCFLSCSIEAYSAYNQNASLVTYMECCDGIYFSVKTQTCPTAEAPERWWYSGMVRVAFSLMESSQGLLLRVWVCDAAFLLLELEALSPWWWWFLLHSPRPGLSPLSSLSFLQISFHASFHPAKVM